MAGSPSEGLIFCFQVMLSIAAKDHPQEGDKPLPGGGLAANKTDPGWW